MPLDREDLRSALTRKGFVEDDRDHEYYFFHRMGKKTSVFTKISRGSGKYKVYGDDLVLSVARQLSLTKKELMSFVECTLKEEPYAELLLERGRIKG